MRHGSPKSSPRHLAGTPRAAWQPSQELADFDVAAALDEDTDFDFEALFDAGGPELEAPPTRVRVARHRIAFAVSVTLAAVPLLVMDNLGARADSPDEVRAEAPAEVEAQVDDVLPERVATTEAPPVVVDVTVAKATVFVAEPATTAKPTTTTTAKPTTTTAKPTTTTTAKPTTTTTAAPPAAVTTAGAPDPNATATWDRLAQCESGGRWNAVSEPRSGQQYYGGLQFSLSTWEHFGGTGRPDQASKDEQIAVGKRVQAKQGWGAWPSCAREFGWL